MPSITIPHSFNDEELYEMLKTKLREAFERAENESRNTGSRDARIASMQAMAALAGELRRLDACAPNRAHKLG